ncbi:hypothetical protein Nmel_011193 [Mimus melanotis]
MKRSTIVVKRTVLPICYYMMICYEIMPPTILYFFRATRKSCWTSQGLQKNLSCHNLCVIFATNEEAAMCLCVMHQGAEEGSNFLQSSLEFVPLALCCAIHYFIPCQSLGSFVVTFGCNAVLQICVQTLWISINGTLLPGKMTLTCSLVRVISVECIGFWVPRMF